MRTLVSSSCWSLRSRYWSLWLSKLTLVGDVNTAQEFLQLAQACTSVSNLLYTISENTTALYERYIRGEQGLAVEAVDAMNKCIDTLKAQK